MHCRPKRSQIFCRTNVFPKPKLCCTQSCGPFQPTLPFDIPHCSTSLSCTSCTTAFPDLPHSSTQVSAVVAAAWERPAKAEVVQLHTAPTDELNHDCWPLMRMLKLKQAPALSSLMGPTTATRSGRLENWEPSSMLYRAYLLDEALLSTAMASRTKMN